MTKPFLTALLLLALGLTASGAISYAIHARVLKPARVREDAFAAIVEGRITPDAAGVANLPDRFAGASADGKVYVTREPTGTTWALFVAERGEGARFRGFALTDRPASAGVSAEVELAYPVPPTPLPDGSVRPALDRVRVKVKRVINPECFEVVSEKK